MTSPPFAGNDDGRGAFSGAPRGPRVRIVCVNDVYSLEQLPRLLTLVRHHKETAPADRFLVTLAGDFVGPSMLSSLDKGRGMIDALNRIGVTHVTFGNHEDDIPLDELRLRIHEFQGTWLNSNIPGFHPQLPSSEVIEVAAPGGRSVRIGLLGVVMHGGSEYRRPPFGGTPIEPANEAALRIAAALIKDHRCTCVLPLTHQDLALDRELAHTAPPDGVPRFPVIIGGHEHRVYIEQVEGSWIVKAGSDAVHAAIIELEWPSAPPPSGPDLPTVNIHLEDTAAYAEDADLRARVNQRLQAVRDLERATLLRVPPGVTLSSIGTRLRQTTLTTLLSSRIRDATGAEGCLMNGGGVRGNREYREHFTYGDLKAELPFDNEVVVAVLPGSVLREAVASTRSKAPEESGSYLHVDDWMHVDEPQHILTAVAGEPIDLQRGYRIALVRNLLTGMDNIEPLVRYAKQHPDCVPPENSGREIKVVLIDAFAKDLFRQLGSFDSIDTDQDGVVNEVELASAVSRLTAAPASPITVGLLLKAVDANTDRVITREEAQGLGNSDSGESC